MAGTSSPVRCSAPSTDTAARWAVRQTPAERAALVDAYTGLVRRIAARCFGRRVGHELEFADFMQFGMVGLLESIDRYTPARGVRFEAYASHRIEGAILSGVQSLSEFQRQVSVRRGLLAQRSQSLVANSVGTAAADESAKASALERLAEVAIGLALGFALEDSGLYLNGEPTVPDNAYARLELIQFKRQLGGLVQRLPENQRLVIFRHYFQQVPFDDIAQTMGLSKGRISQLHHAGLKQLHRLLQETRGFEAIG